MAYLGNSSLPFDPLRSAAPTSDADRFSGNGSTSTFTLSRPVTFPTDIEVFVENIQQEPINSYSVVGTSLVFTEAPPSGTNNVYVVYRNYQSGAQITLPDGSVTYNKLANNIRLFTTDNYTSNAGVSTFTMSEQPADANTVLVTIDGIVQRATEHYSVSGRTITFTSTPAANSLISIRHLGFRTTTTVTAISPGANLSNPIVVNGMSITGNTTLSSGSLVLSPGTAGQPALSFAGNTSTGIFFPATSTIAFSEGGTEAMRLDASGNMGLGVTPSAWFSGYRGFDVGAGALVGGNGSAANGTVLWYNAFYNGTNTVYKYNGSAGIIELGSAGLIAYVAPSGTAGGTVSNTQVLSVDRAKTLALEGATSQSGTGITFPATQSASSNANTLDDYEEGTWTPAIRGSGTAGTYQLSGADGFYTKIGRSVTIICDVAFGTITGGGTGYLQITGIPFSNASGIPGQGVVRMQGLDMTTNYTWLTAMPTTSPTTTWYLAESGDNQAGSDFPISGVSSNDAIRFTATFFTT